MKTDKIKVIIVRYETGFYQPHSEERMDEARAGLAELAALEAKLREWEEREAVCCPEDRGFDEVIAWQRKRIAALEADNARMKKALTEITSTFGGDDPRATLNKIYVIADAALTGSPSGKALVDVMDANERLDQLDRGIGLLEGLWKGDFDIATVQIDFDEVRDWLAAKIKEAEDGS